MWLGLLLLVLVIDVAFVLLGRWQLGVAQHTGEDPQSVATGPARPLTEVLAPHSGFPNDASNTVVTMTGTYAADGQVLVAPRRLAGVTGAWVVTPLRVSGTGAVIAVLRGFVAGESGAAPVPSVGTVPAPPQGVVTVVGTLAPPESPAPSPDPANPDVLASVDMSVLVNRWAPPAYNAFVFATGEARDGRAVAADAGLTKVPPPATSRPLELRNAAYAVQWWLFAGFALWMWWKMVRNAAVASGAVAASGRPRAPALPRAETGDDGPRD